MIYQVLYLHNPKSPPGPTGRNFYLHFADEEIDNIKQLVQSQITNKQEGWDLNLGLPDCKSEYFHHTAISSRNPRPKK